MNRLLFYSLFSLSFTLLLSSCFTQNEVTTHRTYCNALKSNIIFNGGTSNTRNAEIQRAEIPLNQHSYERANCDQL